jgi:broad-specificity NMP kinase
VKRVLITGMSGTGKSTVSAELAARGYKAVDTDYGGLSEVVSVPHDQQTGLGRGIVDLLREAGIDPVCLTITGGDQVVRAAHREYRVPKRDLVSSVNAAMQTRRLKAAESLAD